MRKKHRFQPKSLRSLTDDVLLRRLSELVQQSRRVESEIVAHIAEVDERRLYLGQGCSSMFVYATEVLHLSEAEAYLRITVARASRQHPILLDMLADGRLHLRGIVMLAPLLTPANRDDVLQRAVGKSKRQLEELVAELSPKPDVPARVRELPSRRKKVREGSSPELCPGRVDAAPAPEPAAPAVVQPLSPSRYRFEFTGDSELRDMLERLQALMRPSIPDGDLAAVIKDAVMEKLERLEARRYGKTKSPRKSLSETDTSAKSRHIPAAVKRAVWERDGGRCTYVSPDGRRCTETRGLHYHHDEAYGRGGDHRTANVRLVCGQHNGHLAELEYGKEVMDRYRRSGSRVSEPIATYGANPTLPGQSFKSGGETKYQRIASGAPGSRQAPCAVA